MIKALIYKLLNSTFHDFTVELFNIVKNKKEIIIFDIGCYKGTFFNIFYESKKLEDIKKKIYIFDPNPRVKKYLKKFIQKKNIFFENKAVGSKNKIITFNLNESFESSGSSITNIFMRDKKWVFTRDLFLKFFFQNTEGFKKIKTSSITLDSYVKKKNIKKIDILKIDVEAAELEVLKGMSNCLKKNLIKAIQIEITDKKISFLKKENKIKKILLKNNFIFVGRKNLSSVSILSNIRSTESLYINKRN